jgi:D-alanyl-D-alanine carboxypeptidase (penicillin-binding protein 5/6)
VRLGIGGGMAASALAACVLAGGGAAAAPPEGRPAAGPALVAPSAVLMDAASGQTLFGRNARQERPPASMAKLMTLVLAVEALRAGRVRGTDLVSVSDRAYRTGGSQIWLEPGETLPFRQLLVALAVGSANDAAVAVAEHLAGNVDRFVAEMNRKARAIGMTRTTFVNPNGLDEPGRPTRTTAEDIARLGVYASRYPELLRLTGTREDRTIRNGRGGTLWLVNHNRLLGRVWGLDGLKTGYTRAAGYCLAATARRDDLRLVAVVMGDPTSRQRFADAQALLEWGFAHYRAAVAARAGQRLATVPVAGGEPPWVPGVAAAPLAFTVPAGGQAARPSLRLSLRRLSAPLRRGQVIGVATARLGDRTARVAVVAARAVPRATLGQTVRRLLGGIAGRPARDGPRRKMAT